MLHGSNAWKECCYNEFVSLTPSSADCKCQNSPFPILATGNSHIHKGCQKEVPKVFVGENRKTTRKKVRKSTNKRERKED